MEEESACGPAMEGDVEFYPAGWERGQFGE